MSVLNEALEFLGLAGGSNRYARRDTGTTRTRQEQRELAEAMRALPGRYVGRLPARTLEQITAAAAAGHWEQAVDELITALHARAEAITTDELEGLRAVLDALNMTREHLDTLLVQH
jgi:hypothetical protein